MRERRGEYEKTSGGAKGEKMPLPNFKTKKAIKEANLRKESN